MNEKLNRFMSDKVMSQAVYDIILSSFLKRKTHAEMGTEILASSMLAVYALEDAWKELNKFKTENLQKEENNRQIGL
jgi:hypothetical protein